MQYKLYGASAPIFTHTHSVAPRRELFGKGDKKKKNTFYTVYFEYFFTF